MGRLFIDNITNHKKKVIYSFLDEGINLENFIKEGHGKETIWHKQKSKNSLSFNDEESIFNYFELNKNAYKKAFDKVTEGEGYEKKKIRALHSSALASFLLFSNVRKDNKLTIKGISYSEVYFEIESDVIKGRKPSSIDILLRSNENDLLYLECKFSEYYLYTGARKGIASEYLKEETSKKLYDNLCSIKNDYFEPINDNNTTFSLKGNGHLDYYYCEGIKQLISHIVGVHNGFNDNKTETYQKLKNAWENAKSIKIGTVIFDFGKITEPYLQDYSTIYNQLAVVANANNINLQTKVGKTIKVIDKILTYQEILQDSANKDYFDSLTDKIKLFYHLKKQN
jgi:hypothetical protein